MARPDFDGVQDVRLVLGPEDIWVIQWRPEPGVDVRIKLKLGNAGEAVMGEAAGELGEFPLRPQMPDRFEIEVSSLVGGRVVRAITLTARN